LRGQLLLILDDDLGADLGGRVLRYDRDLGLLDTSTKEEA